MSQSSYLVITKSQRADSTDPNSTMKLPEQGSGTKLVMKGLRRAFPEIAAQRDREEREEREREERKLKSRNDNDGGEDRQNGRQASHSQSNIDPRLEDISRCSSVRSNVGEQGSHLSSRRSINAAEESNHRQSRRSALAGEHTSHRQSRRGTFAGNDIIPEEPRLSNTVNHRDNRQHHEDEVPLLPQPRSSRRDSHRPSKRDGPSVSSGSSRSRESNVSGGAADDEMKNWGNAFNEERSRPWPRRN